MAKVRFEGDFNDVSEKQLQFITEVLNKNGFEGSKVSIKMLGAVGDNYMASVKRVVAEKDGNVFKMVAKIAPTNLQIREAQNVKGAYSNENIMYNKVLPKLKELEISAGKLETKRYIFPVCYGFLLEDMNEVTLLEDLSESDFTMLDRFISLKDDCVRQVLQNFAKLHAFSYALKSKEPETFKNIKSTLIDIWDNEAVIDVVTPILEASERDVIAHLDQDKYKAAVKGTISKVNQLYIKQVKLDRESRFSVILHGDAWTNNIMFRLEEGTAVDCCMIDYQISRIGSPVTDLTYFLFNCTDYETRKAHFHDWIDFYYAELDKELDHFGLRSHYVYPKDQLDADLKRHSKVALATALLLSTVIVRESAEAENFKSSMKETDIDSAAEAFKVTSLKEKSIALFKSKVEGLVDSFYDFGYF